MNRIDLTPVDATTPPEPPLDVFNSNRAFLEASGDHYPYTPDDVTAYFRDETSRENGRCYLIRLIGTNEVVGTAGMAVPYVKVGCPWIGLLLINTRFQGQGLGAEASRLIDAMLIAEGWPEVRLGVLRSNPGAKSFWTRQGYVVIGERDDSEGHPIWVMRKRLASPD